MGEVGELLALLHTSTQRYRTLRAVVREWTHLLRLEQAIARYSERRAAAGQSGWALYGDREAPGETSEIVTRIWVDPPRRRAETDSDGHEHRFVDDGTRAVGIWNGGAMEIPSQPDERLLAVDPSWLVGSVDLTLDGETSVAGRRVVRVRARLREREYAAPVPELLEAADEHDLLVDAERGVVLRAASLLDGEPFQVREALEIAFDEEFPDGTFSLELPPGTHVRRPEDVPSPEHTGIEEAAASLPFPLYVPRELPEPWQLDDCRVFGSEDSRGAHIHYSLGFDGHLSLTEHASGSGPVADGDDVLVEDVRLRVGERHGQLWVAARPPGTDVHLQGNLTRGQLLAVAASLVPVPAEPPDLAEAAP